MSDDREWIDKVKHDHLTIEEWGQLKTLLLKRADAFAKSDDEMGLCNYFKASLPVKDNTGFLYLKPRPLPHGQQALIGNANVNAFIGILHLNLQTKE